MPTTEVIVDIVKNVSPLVTGVGGALVTLWKGAHGIFRRLGSLEKDISQLRSKVVTLTTKASELDAKLLAEVRRGASAKEGIDEVSSSVGLILRDVVKVQQDQAKLSERLYSLEQRVEELGSALCQYNANLVSFSKEQNEQWQSIHRTLGHLEGYIRGRESVHDD